MKIFNLLKNVTLIILFTFGYGQNLKKEYGGTVVIGLEADFDSFNELTAADSDALQVIQHMLFMALTRLDENLEFKPYLAKSWEFSPDHRMVTFRLRDDVSWNDGLPTTAEDVLFTYRLMTNPEVGYPASSRFDLTDRVEIIDRYTVRFYFKKAYPDVLFDLQMPALPAHYLEKIPVAQIAQSEFNRKPVGNGPFKLIKWKANSHLIFVANPDYAAGRPYLDRVIFTIIPDENVRLINLLTQEIDVIPFLTPNGFKQVQKNPALRALRYEGREFTFIAWNLARPLFTKPVRQALTYAINKQEIIDTLLEGFAEPAIGPLMPFNWAFDKSLKDYTYNPEKARNLLNEAGWVDSNGDGLLDREGKSFQFALKVNAGSQLRKDVAVMVQAQLKKIGVHVEIEILEWNLFIDRVFQQRDFDAVILAWEAPFTVNPTDLWHSKAIEQGYNFVSYRNPKVDLLLEKGRYATDRDTARRYWSEFQRIILNDCPYTFLFIPDRLAAINRRIHGVKMDVRGFLANIEEWWIPVKDRKSVAAHE